MMINEPTAFASVAHSSAFPGAAIGVFAGTAC